MNLSRSHDGIEVCLLRALKRSVKAFIWAITAGANWPRWMLVCDAISAAGQRIPENAVEPAMLKTEFLFSTNAVAFRQCHASTIVETKHGLAAAWFGGSAEGHKDVGIWFSRHTDQWRAPVHVAVGAQADASPEPCWNPVLFQPKNGPLMLFYKVGPSPGKWWGMMITSQDEGATWTKPQRLPQGILGPIKNKPVELAGGVILCPSSSEHAGWRVHFERSADGGKSWEATPSIETHGEFEAIQPSILFHPGNRLQALGRTRQSKIFQIWSDDGGKTWGKMTGTDLPNPNSGIDAVTLKNGRQLLVYNHTRKGRTPLNVAVSANGQDWLPALVLENSPGEYSYPAVIQSRDGLVHITYTWKRVCIKHVVINPEKFSLHQ